MLLSQDPEKKLRLEKQFYELATGKNFDADILKRLEQLIEQGVDPNLVSYLRMRYYCRESPLHYLLINKVPTEFLEQYLNLPGVQIDIRDYQKATPLHYAALLGDREYLELLIKKGADVNLVNRDGNTPLHAAAIGGCIKPLIDAGCDLDLKNKKGTTPLMAILKSGNPECLQFLIENKYLAVDYVTQHDENLLHCAVKSGKGETVRYLIAQGVNIDGQDKYGNTPLHLAAKCQNSTIIELLCKAKANSNIQDKNGETPLHCVIVAPGKSIIESLLMKEDSAWNITEEEARAKTPVCMALMKSNREWIKECRMAKDPDLSAAEPPLYSPYEWKFIVLENQIKNVKIILDHGALVDIQDKNGETPLHFAMYFFPDSKDIVKLFNSFKILHIPQLLVNKKADVTIQNNKGNTVLHAAVQRGSHKLVKFILNVNPNLFDVLNKNGDTVLHVAVQRGSHKLVKFILNVNPNLSDMLNKNGRSPLDIALLSHCKDGYITHKAAGLPMIKTLIAMMNKEVVHQYAQQLGLTSLLGKFFNAQIKEVKSAETQKNKNPCASVVEDKGSERFMGEALVGQNNSGAESQELDKKSDKNNSSEVEEASEEEQVQIVETQVNDEQNDQLPKEKENTQNSNLDESQAAWKKFCALIGPWALIQKPISENRKHWTWVEAEEKLQEANIPVLLGQGVQQLISHNSDDFPWESINEWAGPYTLGLEVKGLLKQ